LPAVAEATNYGNVMLEGSRHQESRVIQILGLHRIAAGASPKEVAVRAGHTSTSFGLDRYGHLFPESDAALRDRLDELFVPVTEQRRNTTA
jgi:phage gp37-like protein